MSDHQMIQFCPNCFATEHDGSWGSTVHGQWCSNCGATGTIPMPRWAVESIRSNASFVGKRYYPIDEDFEASRELKELRALQTSFPGRSAELKQSHLGEGPYWSVSQKMGRKTRYITVSADKAKTPEEALEAAKCDLPYVKDPDQEYPTKSFPGWDQELDRAETSELS